MENQKDESFDITFEGSIAVWQCNVIGDINGTYIGTFKFKPYLKPSEKIAANREYREMIGPNPSFVPEAEGFLCYALTQLKYRIISAPPFWTSTLDASRFSGDIPDENVLTNVLDAAVRAELKYREILKNRKTEAIKKAETEANKIADEAEHTEEDSTLED